jgi:GNAT superfamily N-acetyltransferase
MPLSHTIRQAHASDIDAMSTLVGMLFEVEHDFRPDPKRQRAGLERLLASTSTACVLVAEYDKRVVGMSTAQAVISTAEGTEAALIEDVVVAPAYRRRGIATALLEGIAAWSGRRGIRRLQLLADSTNETACAFYHGRGWRHTSLVCLRRRLPRGDHFPGGTR